MNWYDQKNIDNLCMLLRRKLSASEIANWYGNGTTRNAIISAVKRLREKGLITDRFHRQQGFRMAEKVKDKPKSKAKAKKPAPEPVQRITRTKPKPPMMPVAPVGLLRFNEQHHGGDLVSRGLNQCKWPVSADGVYPTIFCSAEQLEGKPYCEYHTNWARRR